jgi:ABC-2 type transport system permease protein
MLFFVLIPTVTMRLFADEVKNRTDQLLYTSPLSVWQIVLGKYLAASCLFLGTMVVTMLFPLTISRFGILPVSQIVGAYIGYMLMGLGFIALGLFLSVMSENQIVSAVATFGAIFFFFILDGLAGGVPADANSSLIFVLVLVLALAGVLYHSTKNVYGAAVLAVTGAGAAIVVFFVNRLVFDGIIGRIFTWLSVFSRFNNLTRGILNLSDIVFYLTFALMFIYLTVNVIEKRRWR